MSTPIEENKRSLVPYLGKKEVWAISVGTAIGWGSLVVTASTYLAKAGPLGSVIGILVGGAIMLLICRCYHYMMDCYPSAGGAYTFTREAFGYDRGFLAAWFLMMTYLAILWANATSIPLFARFFLGRVFCVGYMYTLFGYDVYIGEVLLTIAALLLTGLICSQSRRMVARAMFLLVCCFCIGITVCFAAAFLRRGQAITPAFIPEKNELSQTVYIVFISSWAFIGFESVSHAGEELTFKTKKIFPVLVASVVVTTLLYIFVTLLSVTAYPPEYENWLAYIRDLGNLSGLTALPAFYAAEHYLGAFGVNALMVSLLCLILSSLIGNTLAISRLIYAMAKDTILPRRFSLLSRRGIPSNAVLLATVGSCVVPFVGRTAIGWIVDTTTLGATLIYGFVGAAVWKTAAFRHDGREKHIGRAVTLIMVLIGLGLLAPNIISRSGTIEPESYFLFVVWSVLGLIYFHAVMWRDEKQRFGKAIVVWVVFVSLILIVSLLWMSEYSVRATAAGIESIQSYYLDAGVTVDGSRYISEVLEDVRSAETMSMVVVLIVFLMSVGSLLLNYFTMHRRAIESEKALSSVIAKANIDPMTGVKSKLAYTEAVTLLNELIHRGEQREFGILVCDVNGLKRINDTQGHKAGDKYIFDSCRLICDIYCHSPVFRVGGDEFVVLLQGQDYTRRDELKESFDRQIERNLKFEGAVIVSAGGADYMPGKDTNFNDVFERADKEMYLRKMELKKMGAVIRD